MTNQAQPQQQQTKVLELPVARYPLVNRVIADHPFPTETPQGQTVESFRAPAVIWTIAQPHPLVADLKVVRMYMVPGVSVEIYSMKSDGTLGVRNIIPWNQVRLAEEICDVQSFIDEITAAEEDDDDDDDDDPNEPKPDPTAVSPNGLQPLPPMNGGGVS